jgi:hypothetical protein
MRHNAAMNLAPVQAELIAVLVAVTHGDPRVLTIESGSALPSGQLETGHRSLQTGLRAWVARQTHHPLGYVEQLYTFADQRPHGLRSISISYLGLSREGATTDPTTDWCSWYTYFPWEDRRRPTTLITRVILPRLASWSGHDTARRLRVASLFGQDGRSWNEELVLQRYELLYEAGLVQEAIRARPSLPADPLPGAAMAYDHRRILATAIARLRAKIKYRPVVFELLPDTFTMLELQQAIEALAGQTLHKPNFRRLIEQQDLVEETGQVSAGLAGRPAKLFRFRPSVLEEREFSGTKLPLIR